MKKYSNLLIVKLLIFVEFDIVKTVSALGQTQRGPVLIGIRVKTASDSSEKVVW